MRKPLQTFPIATVHSTYCVFARANMYNEFPIATALCADESVPEKREPFLLQASAKTAMSTVYGRLDMFARESYPKLKLIDLTAMRHWRIIYLWYS